MTSSSEPSLNPTVTFEVGRVMMRPRSRVVSSDVLFLPSSMMASPILIFSLVIVVTPPLTTRFPLIETPPDTTRTFAPTSSTYTFDPILRVCWGFVLMIPTLEDVTKELWDVLLKYTVLASITLPRSVAPSRVVSIISVAASPDSVISFVSLLYIKSTIFGSSYSGLLRMG